MFPIPFDHGLSRLKEVFGLVPVELPTTRRMDATPRERAADITAAFADPSVKAVIAAIGGEDQITVIPHLDDEVIRANPKPFFGYSDNTNLLAHLWRLGVVSYHGGSVMVQFGRGGAMHPITEASLRAAFFTSGPYELGESPEYGDVEQDWEDPQFINGEPVMRECAGWIWHNADRVVEGTTWGGNLEILSWMLAADRDIADARGVHGDDPSHRDQRGDALGGRGVPHAAQPRGAGDPGAVRGGGVRAGQGVVVRTPQRARGEGDLRAGAARGDPQGPGRLRAGGDGGLRRRLRATPTRRWSSPTEDRCGS